MEQISRITKRYAFEWTLTCVMVTLLFCLPVYHCGDDDDDSSSPTPTPIPSATPTGTPDLLNPPVLTSPVDGETLQYFNPEFKVANSPSHIPGVTLFYEFRVAYDRQLEDVVTPFPNYLLIREGNDGFTRWQWESGLFDLTSYFWSCRVTDGENYSGWAEPFRFNTNICQQLFSSSRSLPPGPDPYADAVVTTEINERDNCFTDATKALGAPDASGSNSDEATYKGIVSLGFGGGIIVDMGAGEEILNGTGVDFKIHQFASIEAIQVWASQDNVNFVNLGTRSTPYEFDLSWGSLASARYLAIKDQSATNKPDYNAHTPGADIDAVEAYYYNK